MADANVEAPHDKRRMRIEAREGLCGRFYCVEDVFMDRPVQVNVKPDEWAKDGKDPRAVNDFGVPASIRAGWLPEAIKSAMAAKPFPVGLGEAVFVKSPDVGKLTEIFKKMFNRNLFVYHSDDSALSLVCSDGMFWCNLDISSCDTSQGSCVFEFMYLLCPVEFLRIMSFLLDQCAQTCKVGHGKSRLLFKPVRYFEYSGSLLTTLLNCVASFNIGRQILEGWSGGTREEARSYVNSVLERCGWKVTCEEEPMFSGVQFLKHSPARTEDGEIVACTNLGVLLRALGQKTGTLPKGDPYEQAVLFNTGLVSGFKHAGNTSLLRILQDKYPVRVPAAIVDRHGSNITKYHSNGNSSPISDDSVRCRYRLTPGAYWEMLDLLAVSQVGDVIDCEASRAILFRDYGL